MNYKLNAMDFDIAKFKQRDEQQFSILFRKYQPPILHYLKRMLVREDDVVAEDIVSETMIKAWNKANEFESESNIRAFMYLVAKNSAFNHLQEVTRKNKSHKEILYLNGEAEEPDLAQNFDVINADVIGYLRQELEKNPAKQNVIFLRYLNGETTSQIATDLGIAGKSVLNMKLRAMSLVKTKVKQFIENGRTLTKAQQLPLVETIVPPKRMRGRGKVRSSFNDPIIPGEKITYLLYEEAKKYVQETLVPIGVDTPGKVSTFMASRHPLINPFLPIYVDKYYRSTKEWKGDRDFFGEDVFMKKWLKKGYLPYEEARQWVIDNLVPIGIDSQSKFYKYKNDKTGESKIELPSNIPRAPVDVYSKIGAWESWPEYFGRENLFEDRKKKFTPLEEVKKFITQHDPFGRITWKRWQDWIQGRDKKLPKPSFTVPGRPEQQYEDWQGYDYLNLFNEYNK